MKKKIQYFIQTEICYPVYEYDAVLYCLVECDHCIRKKKTGFFKQISIFVHVVIKIKEYERICSRCGSLLSLIEIQNSAI